MPAKKNSKAEEYGPAVTRLRSQGHNYESAAKVLNISRSMAHRASQVVGLGKFGDHQDRKIVNAIFASPSPMSPKQVADAIEASLTTTRHRINELTKRGALELVKAPEGSQCPRSLHYKALSPAPKLDSPEPVYTARRIVRKVPAGSLILGDGAHRLATIIGVAIDPSTVASVTAPPPHNCKTRWAGGVNPFAAMAGQVQH